MTAEHPSPLDRFIDQSLADQEAGEVRPLGKYLEMFPGTDSVIAGEYLSLTEGGMERFRREAEVASRLGHPGICPVYEAGVDDARPYIVMRCVEGETLARRIASSREATETDGGSTT